MLTVVMMQVPYSANRLRLKQSAVAHQSTHQKSRNVTTANTAGRTSKDDRNNLRAVWSSGEFANRIEAINIGQAEAITAIEPTIAPLMPKGNQQSVTPIPINTAEPTILCQPALRPVGSSVVVILNPAS